MSAVDPQPTYRARVAVPLAGLLVSVAAGLANVALALGAVAVGAEEVDALAAPSLVVLSVIAGFIGALGWHLINRRAANPARVMSWLVPTFVLVSLVPDFLVVAEMGWLVAGTLMLMHVVTAIIAVAGYRRILPLRAPR